MLMPRRGSRAAAAIASRSGNRVSQLDVMAAAHGGKTDVRSCFGCDVPRMVELTRPEGSNSDGANSS